VASTAGDIITGALLNINSYSPGAPLNAQDATVGLNTLNDLLDSLSNDEAFVYTQQETIFSWISNQFEYAVGNPVGGTFLGNTTAGSAVITNVTSLPGQLAVGATITDLQSLVPTGTALFPVATTVIGIGTTTVTLSANATATSNGLDTFTYTVPGDIPISRPLRFRSGFTRANQSGLSMLDYTFTFTDFDAYKRELLKSVPGPWPYVAAYQPTFPYGTVYVYPAPSANYTAHIFSDLLLSEFASVTAPYSMPQGYTRALKKLLGLELCPIYGKTPSAELRLQAKEAKELLKNTNETPVAVLQYDTALARTQVNDASWIQHGGFS
jgi:hypothetical protein